MAAWISRPAIGAPGRGPPGGPPRRPGQDRSPGGRV